MKITFGCITFFKYTPEIGRGVPLRGVVKHSGVAVVFLGQIV
jgi:hypothetical protein